MQTSQVPGARRSPYDFRGAQFNSRHCELLCWQRQLRGAETSAGHSRSGPKVRTVHRLLFSFAENSRSAKLARENGLPSGQRWDSVGTVSGYLPRSAAGPKIAV